MNKIPILLTTLIAGVVLAMSPGADAKQLQVEVDLANPLLEAGKKNTTYLKIGLTGFTLEPSAERAPVNVVLVIDKSGSMSGEKIRGAREAAKMAIQRLGEDDIVSLVAYDATVHVLIPATKLTDPEAALKRIDELGSGGSTALFAGVSRGAAELRKFLDRDRVNRVILLSDGNANVGPSSPGELGELGESLVKEGISVTTIGLGTGYNEDLMAQLARKSDGNHIYIEHEEQLVQAYGEEFGDILSVVAQEIMIEIDFAKGVRPVRVLGREADISGQHVVTQLNQLYSEQEKYVLVELEVPEGAAENSRQIATVKVGYANMETNTFDEHTSTVGVKFVAGAAEVMKSINQTVMVDCVTQIANETNIAAMRLRDQGKVPEAQQLLHQNFYFCESNAAWLKSPQLSQLAINNRIDFDNVQLGEAGWRSARKGMVYNQNGYVTQQKGYTRGGENAQSKIAENQNEGYKNAQPKQSPPIPAQNPLEAQQQLLNVPRILPVTPPVQQDGEPQRIQPTQSQSPDQQQAVPRPNQ
ncbi:MAG: Ca-activated chloride channel family protein [Verrucomicrobiales bacterium]|jgi:Ca-activated chloride channel family protein